MRLKKTMTMGIGLALLAGLAGAADAQLLQDHTYQGRLENGGEPAQGVHQIRFRVYDAAGGGSQLTTIIREKNFGAADNGLFTFDDLSFGSLLDSGEDRWIELSARQGNAGPWTVLGPRQPITSAPTADVARRLALPYADSGTASQLMSLTNTSTLDTTLHLQAGVGDTGLAFIPPTLLIETPENGQSFTFQAAGDLVSINGWSEYPGSTGTQGVRFPNAPDGVALRALDAANFNTAEFGRADYAGDFFGPIRTQGAVDIMGEEIEADEIFNEPGIASDIPAIGFGFALTSSNQNVAIRSITVPGPGYVMAIATGDMQLSHSSGSTLDVVFGVSDTSATIPIQQDIQTRLPSTAPSGTYDIPATAHGVFTVNSAGTHTFYFVAREFLGDGAVIWDVNFTLVYFPTAYGFVDSNLPAPRGGEPPQLSQPVRGPLTEQERRAEREAELARHMAALDAKQREMENLLVEIETLRARMHTGKTE